MLVSIVGGNKTIRSLTQSLVEYCANKLNLNDSIILDIEFTNKLYKEDGLLGEIDFDEFIEWCAFDQMSSLICFERACHAQVGR